jgi:hypothetical protein
MPVQLFTANGVNFRGIKDYDQATEFTLEQQDAM